MKISVLILPIIVVLISLIFISKYLKKDSFAEITTPTSSGSDLVTQTFLTNLLAKYIPPTSSSGGANVTTNQGLYDLLFMDILISSDKRNKIRFPNPNNYTINLNVNVNMIYKAELVEVYVPSATDDAVNIPTDGNRLYFGYYSKCISKSTEGYIIISAGTYVSPASVACELQKQFNKVLSLAGFNLKEKGIGINVTYNENLNRYIFSDKNQKEIGNFVIFPDNGFIINKDLIVMNSIAEYLMLNYTTPKITKPYFSGPKYINSTDNVLFVDIAYPGDYGEFTYKYKDTSGIIVDTSSTTVFVPSSCNPPFSNCIISDVVLTNCKIFLSLDRLNGNTCYVVHDQSADSLGRNVPYLFCQVPNNTSVSSKSVKTLLNQPHNYSSTQIYNPPISAMNVLNIQWFDEYGKLLRILDHCFTIRLSYFQKKLATTDFSYPVIQ